MPSQLYTVIQFAARHPAFTPGSLRWLIFNEQYNGLKASGAVKRLGRRVLIDEGRFFDWIEQLQDDSDAH